MVGGSIGRKGAIVYSTLETPNRTSRFNNCRRTVLGTQKIRERIVYPEYCMLLEAEKPV
jgi:hypothetical protein